MRAGLQRQPSALRPITYLTAAGLALAWSGLELHRRLPGHHDPHLISSIGSHALTFGVLAVAIAVAMGPCVMQMGILLIAFWSGIPPSQLAGAGDRQRVSPVAWFLLGYLGVFLLLAALLITLGHHASGLQSYLSILAGVILLASGLRLLELRRRPSHACSGPGGFLLRYGRYHPAGMGMAFAAYCGACCGPYLAGAGVLIAERGWGTGAVIGTWLLLLIMAAPIVTPLVLRARRVQDWLSLHGPAVRPVAGLFFCGIGLYLSLHRLFLA